MFKISVLGGWLQVSRELHPEAVPFADRLATGCSACDSHCQLQIRALARVPRAADSKPGLE